MSGEAGAASGEGTVDHLLGQAERLHHARYRRLGARRHSQDVEL